MILQKLKLLNLIDQKEVKNLLKRLLFEVVDLKETTVRDLPNNYEKKLILQLHVPT